MYHNHISTSRDLEKCSEDSILPHAHQNKQKLRSLTDLLKIAQREIGGLENHSPPISWSKS